MPVIYVRTVDGRVARSSPKGSFIPSDKFVPVQQTPYIDRLINVHGDIEVQPKPKAESKPVVPPIKD